MATTPHGYFVTGTDTGVGKTFVTSHLARRGRAAGKRVFAFKPIETGVRGRYGEDQMALIAATGSWQKGTLGGVYGFTTPMSPLAAAEAERIEIDINSIEETFHQGSAQAQLTLVEGAGGWRVPITKTMDMALFAKRLGLPILLVTRATLGTINHTLLTIEAIARDGCRLAGVVMSQQPSDDAVLARSNLEAIIACPLVLTNEVPVVVLREDFEVLDRFT